MKKIYYILFVVSAFVFASCSEDSEGVSKVTTYCTLDMSGNAIMFNAVGTPFTDPGCVAHEGEAEVPVTVKSNVDPNNIGIYNITYTAVNSDGFPASVSRQVLIGYNNPNIGGAWTSTIVRNGTTNRGPYTFGLLPLTENTFYTPDLLGGWYWIGSAYGPTYAFPAVLQIGSDNTLTVIETEPSAWGSVGQLVTTSVTPTIDQTAGIIHYVAKMSDSDTYLFDVTLTKQ